MRTAMVMPLDTVRRVVIVMLLGLAARSAEFAPFVDTATVAGLTNGDVTVAAVASQPGGKVNTSRDPTGSSGADSCPPTTHSSPSGLALPMATTRGDTRGWAKVPSKTATLPTPAPVKVPSWSTTRTCTW